MVHVWFMYGSCMIHVWFMYSSCMFQVHFKYSPFTVQVQFKYSVGTVQSVCCVINVISRGIYKPTSCTLMPTTYYILKITLLYVFHAYLWCLGVFSIF